MYCKCRKTCLKYSRGGTAGPIGATGASGPAIDPYPISVVVDPEFLQIISLNGTIEIVDFPIVSVDTDNRFSNQDTYTVPVDGIYNFSVELTLQLSQIPSLGSVVVTVGVRVQPPTGVATNNIIVSSNFLNGGEEAAQFIRTLTGVTKLNLKEQSKASIYIIATRVDFTKGGSLSVIGGHLIGNLL